MNVFWLTNIFWPFKDGLLFVSFLFVEGEHTPHTTGWVKVSNVTEIHLKFEFNFKPRRLKKSEITTAETTDKR